MSRLIVLHALLLIGLARAHEAMWMAPAFGSLDNNDELDYPLNSGSGPNWMCRGLLPSSSQGVITLTVGQPVSLLIGCSQDSADAGQACREDPGSLHSADGSRTGCALAIAYKNFSNIQPSDFAVFSVLYQCVDPNSNHTFQVPNNLPATNGSPVTCAWTWIPSEQAAADEMYMTCFQCEVISQTTGSFTTNSNPVMLFWGVPYSNLPPARPYYSDKFHDGAQTLVIEDSSNSPPQTSQTGPTFPASPASAPSPSSSPSPSSPLLNQCQRKGNPFVHVSKVRRMLFKGSSKH